MKKTIIITLIILIIAVLVRTFIYTWDGWQMDKAKKMAKAPGVVVEEVDTKFVYKKFEAPARIQSVSRIDVVARVSGYLTKSYFKEGDYVKKGQVLFEIEPQEYQLAANKAKANIAQAQAQLTYNEKQLVRYRELVQKDYISKAKYDEVLSNRDFYKAQVAINKSAYEDAMRNLSYTKVKAPVDGQVGMIKITVGNYVSAQSGVLTTVMSVNPIYVSFPLDTKNYAELLKVDKSPNVNRKVELYLSNGTKYALLGEQNFHDNTVDPTTGAITMRATFPNPDGALINGNYATVYIYSKEKEEAPVVSQVAVMENPQYKYVYVLDEKCLPQIRQIETYGQEGKDWVVKSGLKKGDKVIVNGIQYVIPGKPVKILTQEELDKINSTQTETNSKKDKK